MEAKQRETVNVRQRERGNVRQSERDNYDCDVDKCFSYSTSLPTVAVFSHTGEQLVQCQGHWFHHLSLQDIIVIVNHHCRSMH